MIDRTPSLGRGMKLGGGRKESLSVREWRVDEQQGVIAEDHLSVPAAGKVSRARTETPTSDVSVEIAEELNVKLSRDGLIETADVKGTLSVRANRSEASRVSVSERVRKRGVPAASASDDRSFVPE